MTQLSPNFTLAELTRSEYAARNGIDMTPPADVLRNIKSLCNDILEPLRALVGAPLNITSGYRPLAVNKAIGGAATSAHVFGCAADLHAQNFDVDGLFNLIRTCNKPFMLLVDQTIQEYGQWVHIALPAKGAPRHQFLIATHGPNGTIYTPA